MDYFLNQSPIMLIGKFLANLCCLVQEISKVGPRKTNELELFLQGVENMMGVLAGWSQLCGVQ